MKLSYIIIILFLFSNNSQENNCDQFNDGKYEYYINGFQVYLEKYKNFQYEYSEELGVEYLIKSEEINDCNFKLTKYKIINNDFFEGLNSKNISYTKITKIEDNFFYFESMIDEKVIFEGKFKKISNRVSERFKKILDLN